MCSSKTAQAAFCSVDRTDILELRRDGVEGVLDGAHPLRLPSGIPLAVIVHPPPVRPQGFLSHLFCYRLTVAIDCGGTVQIGRLLGDHDDGSNVPADQVQPPLWALLLRAAGEIGLPTSVSFRERTDPRLRDFSGRAPANPLFC